jgi:hypothetical protein
MNIRIGEEIGPRICNSLSAYHTMHICNFNIKYQNTSLGYIVVIAECIWHSRHVRGQRHCSSYSTFIAKVGKNQTLERAGKWKETVLAWVAELRKTWTTIKYAYRFKTHPHTSLGYFILNLVKYTSPTLLSTLYQEFMVELKNERKLVHAFMERTYMVFIVFILKWMV